MRKLVVPKKEYRSRIFQFRLTPNEYKKFDEVSRENKVSKAYLLRYALKKAEIMECDSINN